MHDGFEKRAGGQDHRAGLIERITGDSDAGDFAVVGFNRFDGFLAERQIVLQLNPVFHLKLIRFFVRLSPRTVHGRTFATVEHPEMNPGGINHAAHFAAERIDFADNLALGNSSDRRIAAHLCDRVAIHRQ